jgi:hypothetical protein
MQESRMASYSKPGAGLVAPLGTIRQSKPESSTLLLTAPAEFSLDQLSILGADSTGRTSQDFASLLKSAHYTSYFGDRPHPGLRATRRCYANRQLAPLSLQRVYDCPKYDRSGPLSR